MSKIIVVTGQSGVGKDFLVSRAHPEEFGIQHANWGDLFRDLVQHEDKDSLDKAFRPDAEQTERIQALVVEQVLDMQPLIITSHPVKIEGDKEFVNWDIEKTISPTDYIFVRAMPEAIARRVHERNLCGERQTPELSVEELASVQDRKLELMQELADHVGSRLTVIDNHDDTVEQNVAEIRNVMQRLTEEK